jgi:hypothetical protein
MLDWLLWAAVGWTACVVIVMGLIATAPAQEDDE